MVSYDGELLKTSEGGLRSPNPYCTDTSWEPDFSIYCDTWGLSGYGFERMFFLRIVTVAWQKGHCVMESRCLWDEILPQSPIAEYLTGGHQTPIDGNPGFIKPLSR